MGAKRGGSAVWCLLMIVLIARPLTPANAIDRFDARVLELERDLRSTRSRVERAPHTPSFDLDQLQRRLHDLRIDELRDPKVQELEVELRWLRARAARAGGRPGTAALPRRSPRAVLAPIERPEYLGGAHAPAPATPARSYLGARLVALHRTVEAVERGLELGDTAAAARLFEAAQSELATLRRVFDAISADDPNLIALEARIGQLKERLAPR